MFYMLVIVAILAGILYEKSRLLSAFQLLLIWVLLGWSYGNADYQNYLTRYIHYDSSALGARTEILFFQLFKLGNELGFSYQQFLIIVSFVYVLVLGVIIRKLSLNPNLVYALYLIFPACIEATQIRFAFAGAFVLIGFSVLFNPKIKFGEIYFAIFIIIAALFHIGTILFMLMLPVRRMKVKTTYIYTLVVGLMIAFLGMGGVNKILSLFPGMLVKLSFVHVYSFETIIYWIIVEILIWIFFLAMFYTFNHFCEHNRVNEIFKTECIHKIGIISAVTIPVTFFFQDAYRVQQCVCILFFCFFSNVFPKGIFENRGIRMFQTNKTKVLLLISSVIFAFFCLYAIVLSSSNLETVFIPYFEKNIFFESLF